MSMLPYYKKIDLELTTEDWRFLNYLSHTYVDRVNPLRHMGKDNPEYKDFFLQTSEKSYINNPFFKKIADLFIDGSEYNSIEWIYRFSQISLVEDFLPIHPDRRSCAISIPVLPIITPVRWYSTRNESDVVCEYYYEHPVTLINTRELHGATDNTTRRIFFQIGGFTEDIMDVISQLK